MREVDSCNFAKGCICGLLGKKKCISQQNIHLAYSCYKTFSFLFLFFPISLLFSLSLSFGILNRQISLQYPFPIIPPLGVSHIIRHPRKSGSTSCALNVPRSTTMDRVLRHYVTGGSHYWPIRSGALSARLSDFIAIRA